MKRCGFYPALLLLNCVALAQTGQQKDSFTTLEGGIRLRAIAGAPFAADVVKQTSRVLPDGSQVPVITKGKLFRDSEGRTRAETEIVTAAGILQRVTIVDPVQRVTISLNPQTKSAVVSSLPAPLSIAPSARVTAALGKTHAVSGTEALGTQTMEAFEVTGSRRTLPPFAGSRANQAVKSLIESWVSPELKIELEVRTVEPGVSETLTRLQNIVTASPAPTLFQVPADYKVMPAPAAQ